MIDDSARPLSRRALLHGGVLAAALALPACDRAAGPAGGPSRVPLDLMGSFERSDPMTGSRITVTVGGGVRRIVANGLPDHETGRFPNPRNPNAIRAQSYDVSLPTDPRRSARPVPLTLPQPFGLAVNGVPFDPLAAEFWRGDPESGWTVSALGPGVDLGLDVHTAHVQPTGAYHYHGVPAALTGASSSRGHSPIVGWAGDGFPVYAGSGFRDASDPTSPVVDLSSSYRLRPGTRPGGADGPGGAFDGTYDEDWEFVPGVGDLDLANGRVGVTPEYPDGTYHYVLTSGYPVVPRFLAGPVAESFRAGPAAPPGAGRTRPVASPGAGGSTG